jgi:hypothetical protein
VTHRADRVLIVCTGPSVENIAFPPLPGVTTIVVNGALEWHPAPDIFFSLDPSNYVRRLVRHRPARVAAYLAVPGDYGTPGARVVAHRDAPERGVTYLRRSTGGGYLGACYRLSDDPRAIHTGNSAWGALGLAWHMGAARVAFLGLDGTTDRYAYLPGCPVTSFDHLPGLFESSVPQLEARGVLVVNGSRRSCVTCFPRLEASETFGWLLE